MGTMRTIYTNNYTHGYFGVYTRVHGFTLAGLCRWIQVYAQGYTGVHWLECAGGYRCTLAGMCRRIQVYRCTLAGMCRRIQVYTGMQRVTFHAYVHFQQKLVPLS